MQEREASIHTLSATIAIVFKIKVDRIISFRLTAIPNRVKSVGIFKNVLFYCIANIQSVLQRISRFRRLTWHGLLLWRVNNASLFAVEVVKHEKSVRLAVYVFYACALRLYVFLHNLHFLDAFLSFLPNKQGFSTSTDLGTPHTGSWPTQRLQYGYNYIF